MNTIQLEQRSQQSGESLSPLQLPLDQARVHNQAFQYAQQEVWITDDLATALKHLTRRENCTLAETLLTAYITLVFRYCNQKNIAIGLTSMGKATPSGVEHKVECATVLRTDLSVLPTEKQLLSQIHDKNIKVNLQPVNTVKTQIDTSKSQFNNLFPPIQAWFGWGERSYADKELKNWQSLDLTVAPFDLNLSARDTTEGIHITLSYNGSLFCQETIVRMLKNYKTVLSSMTVELQQSLLEIPILSASEKHQLLVEWNNTQTDTTPTQSIQQLFEAQVERTPNATALVLGNESLTYHELNTQVNKLAHFLRGHGGNEQPIGICLERSFAMVIAQLAVLKAGKAYVALDPSYPSNRLGYMVQDAQISLLITQSWLLPTLPEYQGQVLCWESDQHQWNQASPINPSLLTNPKDLAYISYTSGSTGQPKGVLSHHQGVVNYLTFITSTYGIQPTDIVLQMASLSFDASVRDIIGPLTVGAQVVLMKNNEAKDPAALLSTIKAYQVTALLSVVPTMLNSLLDAVHEPTLTYPSLRLILSSGEPLYLSTCRKVHQVFGKQTLVVNQYGPTECTMTSTYYPVTSTEVEQEIALIGRPIANCQVYLLDTTLNPVPIGAIGDVFISSLGLSNGYLNRPALTQERFIDHPFCPGTKLYRTGDLARYRSDGNLQFCGRTDHQIKIGGVRIELGEIEAAILQAPNIQDCKVILRRLSQQQNLISKEGAQTEIPHSTDRHQQLVAYFTSTEQLTTSDLRDFLQQDLPGFMIPRQFIQLPALPMNANGKLDIKALPDPKTVRPSLSNDFVAPSNEMEQMIAEIWQEMIGLDCVGIHDGFFELGGDSLLAMRVINHLSQVTKLNLCLRNLLTTQTIASLTRLIQQEQSKTVETAAIVAQSDTSSIEAYPLSKAQQGIWFLWKMEPNSPYYTAQGLITLKGNLNISVLERAWQMLIERHEMLRVRFASHEGQPIQTFTACPVVEFPVTDLSGYAQQERDQILRQAIQYEGKQPFDLENESIWRYQLFKLSDQVHSLLLTIHEISVDLWSVRVMMQDLSNLYHGLLKGETKPLKPLAVKFSDFTLWEDKQLTRQTLKLQENYWQQQLSGKLPVLDLPLDRPRPTVSSYQGKKVSILLEPDLSQRLQELSRQANTTLFSTLLSAFNVLLNVYTGQEDLIIGAPLAHRSHQETEPLIGFFLNMLPIRTQLADNPTFMELLHGVQATVTGALSHADYPFMWMLEWSDAVRDPKFSPVFQVMFNMLSFPDHALKSETLEMNYSNIETNYTKYDLSLYAQEIGEQIYLQFSYLSDLFDHDTIDRLLQNFVALLDHIVTQPKLPISQLNTIAEPEKKQLLSGFNQTDVAVTDELCLHQLFEQQAAKTPEATALIFAGEQLNYQELNQQANQLAHYLRRLGVQPNVRVALHLQRSFKMLVAILAVMKAGGIYVPLDPHHPTLRLKQILQDTKPSLLLLNRSLDNFEQYDAQKVYLDDDWWKIEQEETSNLANLTTPEDLLNIIYTSGSTGKPKGVMISTKSVLNRLHWMWDAYPFQTDDVTAWQKSYALVAATWEIFGGLLQGVPTLLLSRQELLDPALLWQQLVTHRVTYFLASPAVYQGLLAQGELNPSGWDSLRLATTSAEPITPAMVSQWRNIFPNVPLLNLYGSTECSSNVTEYDVSQMPEDSRFVPIGKPLPNTKVYVLNKDLQPVPRGVIGEMYVSGSCLAHGYFGQPDLTAEKFIPNPYEPNNDSYLYRTGDLVRHRSDGNLELVSRRDFQVKIRGFRVELGEIETTLRGYTGVDQCVVMAREDVPGDKRLVAYLVASNDQILDKYQLRQHLNQKLPDYMMPSAFVHIKSLPLTPSGKVDRLSLPKPEAADIESRGIYRAPGTVLEQQVANIWMEVLNLEQVGIDDDFFELGGHSLLATQIISRIRTLFSVELPLRILFESPTVADLAVAIDQQEPRNVENEIISISRDSHLSLSFAQQRLWFLDQLEGQSATYNIPRALQLSGQLNIYALEQALNEIVRRHEVLRTTFQTKEGEPVQIIASTEFIALPIIDLQTESAPEQSAEVQRLVNEAANEPFDLGSDTLIRVNLMQLSPQSYVLLVTMHHIVSDGWSMSIFVQELSTLYRNFSQGQLPSLPALAIQYVDFAHWQRQYLQGEVLDRQLNYWRQQLADAPTLLDLPTDYPRPPVQTFQGSMVRFHLDTDVSRQLQMFSQQSGTTLFITLLSAFYVLLYRYSHAEDIVIGSPIANRNRREIEPLIGFFANTLLFRSNLKGNPSFSEYLQQVHNMALEAYAHQDLPFEKLVEELNPERNLSYNPLFQVMFVLQNDMSTLSELSGLQLTSFPLERSVAKFDLTLSMRETPEGLVGKFEYRCDLFKEDTIQRLISHFQTLLTGIVNTPEQSISTLPLLTEAEHQRLLVEWNATQTEYPKDKCIHQLFEEQVKRSPDAIAVEFAGEYITYQELNYRANQLAHYLRALGVGTESLVGICLERSIEMAVGVLGILKAGGAYVPLDPNYPAERLTYMLGDAEANILVTQSSLAANTELALDKLTVVCVDSDWDSIAQASQENLAVDITSSCLAYTIYTSGSTGKPKGVQIEHRAAVNFLITMADRPGLTAKDTLIAVTTICFDIAGLELYLPLLTGAKVVIASREVASSGSELAKLLTTTNATIMQATPATWYMLLASGWQGKPGLKVLCGGEALLPDLADQLLERVDSVWNMYGPTEATIWSTVYPVSYSSHASTANNTPEPIGRPIANTQIYILDKQLQPVPIGIAGELHIGGDGLARGYRNRPKLTQEKFITSPFAADTKTEVEQSPRIYKTGDLARYLSDGSIQFLGRIDHQVKLRGFRIELGEIESTLGTHPQVKEAVAIVRQEHMGDQRLVAYVTAYAVSPSVNELYRFLKDKLPDYMVPSGFIILEALPLTPNGKVDRRALPAPDPSQRTLDNEFIAPRNPVEADLSQIWRDLLKLEQVGIHDSFFELGGHSLLATQVVSRIREVFMVELPLRTLFESSTVAELADYIETLNLIKQGNYSDNSVFSEQTVEEREELEF